MKILMLIVILVTLQIELFSQTMTIELRNKFIEKTIEYYFNELLNNEVAKSSFMILEDSLTKYIKTDYEKFKIRFVSEKEANQRIEYKLAKYNRLDQISMKLISQDTCDININGWDISFDSDGFQYFAECGGTLGYIPTCRFVYNYDKKEWLQITQAEIIQEYKKLK